MLILVNYFVGGWFADSIDKYYINNLITISFVFAILCPLFLATYRYYCKMDPFGNALVENYTWTAMFIIFFGGLSTHLSWALLCHFLSIDIQWDATAKVLALPVEYGKWLGTGIVEFLEGIMQSHSRVQMDVHSCGYGDYTDGSPCVCGACHMANKGILCLFTTGIDVSESLYYATGSESSVDVFCLLFVLL